MIKPTQLLKKQHREVEQLFKRIEKSDDGGERRRLLDELTRNLELHMQIEEELFYPAIRSLDTKKATGMTLEAYEEHAVVKLVAREIPKVDPEDERFHAKMTVFQELIEHHVEEEEKEMFKLAEKLDDEQLETLAERMTAALQQAGAPVPDRTSRAA
jgi:hemerythrin superfamily protein